MKTLALISLLCLPIVAQEKPKPLSVEDRDAYQAQLWRLISTNQEIENLLAPCRQNTTGLQGEQKKLSDELTAEVGKLRKKYGAADTCALNGKGAWSCQPVEKKEDKK